MKPLSLIIVLLLLLSACLNKRDNTQSVEKQAEETVPAGDITRPPLIIEKIE